MFINSLNKVINYFGSTTQVARILGVKQQSVSDWRRGRSGVPLDIALHLNMLTCGEVDWKELVTFETVYRLKDLRLSLKEAGIYPCELTNVLLNRIIIQDSLLHPKNQYFYRSRSPCVNENYTLIFGYEVFSSFREKNKKTIPCWKLSLEKLAEGKYLTDDLIRTFLNSELTAIGFALESFLGNRQGKRTDLLNNRLKNDISKQPVENFPQVEIKQGTKTRDFVSKRLGFKNARTYEHAKKILLSGCSELIEQVDQKKISISRAANLAKLYLTNKSKQDSYSLEKIS